MIGKLTGLVDSTDEDHLILDVGGVGYLVFASARTLGRLPAKGAGVSLRIETHVREDQIRLYGFIDRAEQDWFRLMQTVQGVGTRHALAILSTLPPQELAKAIAAQDKAALATANGVGPKLAGRIVAELREKVDGIALGPVLVATQNGVETATAETTTEDAVSALVNLGYRRSEAFGVVVEASRRLGAEAGVETLIREGLKELAS
ncbi:MAG: Holliday junction branch migration protein RuvA [Kiloniellales bacterium]|nr:Holliday junction branch migration protein RuvA [Kiloniellales bacterium]